MDAKEIIARRVALELRDGMLVNLGIGLPTCRFPLRFDPGFPLRTDPA